MNSINDTSPTGNQPLKWLGDKLIILDQTRLPDEEFYIETRDWSVVAGAIKQLRVRGAPAIGVAGAYGVALGALNAPERDKASFLAEVNGIIDAIAATRPTARNLFFALERMRAVLGSVGSPGQLKQRLVEEAVAIHHKEVEATTQIGLYGAELLEDRWTVLTHCNTGPLAAPGFGTALGVIIMAHRQGKRISVYADETRPLLQGARLTTWELQKAGVPVTLITDGMAGHFMKAGKIQCVITGADRIAANGDSANKIGTYTAAVLAKENGIPFYIAAPTTTFDISLQTGDQIPIEERSAEEVTHIRGVPLAPAGTVAANPAFDVTPARYIDGIITELGIVRPPNGETISKLLRSAH